MKWLRLHGHASCLASLFISLSVCAPISGWHSAVAGAGAGFRTRYSELRIRHSPDSVGKPLSGGFSFFICAWYLLCAPYALVPQTFDHFARKLNLNWKFLTPACDNLKSMQEKSGRRRIRIRRPWQKVLRNTGATSPPRCLPYPPWQMFFSNSISKQIYWKPNKPKQRQSQRVALGGREAGFLGSLG